MTCGLLIPSLGGPQLEHCLAAVARLDPAPDHVLVVLSGRQEINIDRQEIHIDSLEILHRSPRLGFAAAINTGLAALSEVELVALLNDDAIPEPHWLLPLRAALQAAPRLAAVQGTVTDAAGEWIDGRGIALDPYGLAVQVDRGLSVCGPEPQEQRPLLAVSGTAALLRRQALIQATLTGGEVFDQSFGSYYEDLDLGLRLGRLGWSTAWVAGAPCRHLGSLTGGRLRWRHPWWLLANRWRALAANLTHGALLRLAPRLLRGELRAVHTLSRKNLRALPVSLAVALSLPLLITRSWYRHSPGPRLEHLDPGRGCPLVSGETG